MGLTDPCSPSTTSATERSFPCWLKRLEVLIRLKESLDRQRVDDAERQESAEDEQPLRVVG
jgi:hypothetical protein